MKTKKLNRSKDKMLNILGDTLSLWKIILQVILSIFFGVVALFFLEAGYSLILFGARGEWEIVSSFKGWTLYITSISPGLFVIFFGAFILVYGLPRVLKKLNANS